METSEHTYESKELQKLIAFLNDNTPLPQQSVPETMGLLDQHAHDTCVEITMNLACLRDFDMGLYYTWWKEKISEVNVKRYKQLLKDFENQKLQMETKTGVDTDELLLGKLFPEGMDQEERKERCKFLCDLLDRYAIKLNEVLDHLVKQLYLNTQVEWLPRKEPGISGELTRMHQMLYEHILDFLEKRGAHLKKEVAQNLMEQLEMMFENQKKEISNNYYEFPGELTRPYLSYMYRNFKNYQQKISKIAQRGPTFIPLRRRSVALLKELREHVQQLQEQQELHFYSSNVYELYSAEDPFDSFLLFYHMGGLAIIQKFPENDDPRLIIIIANFLKISNSLIEEYLKIMSKPVSSWSQEQQLQLKRVTEFVERRSAMLE